MKLLFIPNWNGHLYLQEETDSSVNEVFSKVDFKDKELMKIVKNDITKTNEMIGSRFREVLSSETKVLSVTGDHSNSYSLMREFKKKYTGGKIVIFDAHPDVEVSSDIVSHEDYLRNLIENKFVDAKDVYLFGLRTFSRTEFEYLEEKGINYWTIIDILKDFESVKNILSKIDGEIYLSLDIDVLDPDDAPGTYYKEWCGLRIDELVELVKVVKEKGESLKAVDICEYYKPKDEEDITLKNVLKLINIFLN